MSSNSNPNRRPSLAIVSNCLTPYRIHLHELIAAGIPELALQSIVTHDDADFSWKLAVPASIGAVNIGQKGDSPLASSFSHPVSEWRKGGRLIRCLHEAGAAAVICNGYRYLSYLRVIDHCHRAGIPVFVNNDSNIHSERILAPWKAWTKRRAYTWWIKRTAGIMPMGAWGDEFFIKYGANPKNFYRVPYTPDYDAFADVDGERLQRFRRQYRLSDARQYLMFSGRLAPVKRVDLVIDAFARVAAQRPAWDLLIAGDGPLRAALQSRVPRPLADRVLWTGFLEQEDLKLAYHAAQVLVLPSDHEPWAVVVQEAMAAGMVVVASSVVGAAGELIEDHKSGRMVPPGKVEALSDALLEVTSDENLPRFREQSRRSLADWRRRVDPVAEIRRALVDHGALGS